MKEIKLSNTVFSVSIGNEPDLNEEQRIGFLSNIDKYGEDELQKNLEEKPSLEIEDLDGRVGSDIYKKLYDSYNLERSAKLWDQIEKMPLDTRGQREELSKIVADFVKKGFVVSNERRKVLLRKLEKPEWEALGANPSIEQLRVYRDAHLESAYMDEIDDAMWQHADYTVEQYLDEWPDGRHVREAEAFTTFREKWAKARDSRDIFAVAERYQEMKEPKSGIPQYNEVESLFEELRQEVLGQLIRSKNNLKVEDLQIYIDKRIFTRPELEAAGLLRNGGTSPQPLNLPNLEEYTRDENPNLKAQGNCTDVYFFGIPHTGKTCLMMGLVGANGKDGLYSLVTLGKDGGDYADVLGTYVEAQKLPGPTNTNFTCVVNGFISPNPEIRNDGRHNINLVEMAGENFRRKIAMNRETTNFEDLGTGLKNLLGNNNRKLFFIIVDCTADVINVFNEDSGKLETCYQKKVLARLVQLFAAEENKKFMKKVDAIHFIVTKVDTLGRTQEEQRTKAKTLLNDKYYDAVNNLRNYCKDTKRINKPTYEPQVFTFSLGKFYVGEQYEYDPADSMKIMKVIRAFTPGQSEGGFWDVF